MWNGFDENYDSSNVDSAVGIKKGIFWIVDAECLENNIAYIFKIDTDMNGNILRYDVVYPLNSKHGDNYNHKLVWENYLDKSQTSNLPYNFYPRGRVEVSGGTAKMFINPDIATEKIIDFLKTQFNLLDTPLKVVVDGSTHYKQLKD